MFSIWMTQYFLVSKAFQPQGFCALHAWVFSNKRIEKSYDAIFWGMISKIKTARHTSELQ